MVQTVKNLRTMWETWVWSLRWEDPLEEGMATHSSVLAWKIPIDRGTWWVTVHGIWTEVKWNHSVVSDSLWPHGLYSPWNSPGQNTGVGSRSLLQGMFPTQGSNPGLPHCRQMLYQLSTREAHVYKGIAIISSTNKDCFFLFFPVPSLSLPWAVCFLIF